MDVSGITPGMNSARPDGRVAAVLHDLAKLGMSISQGVTILMAEDGLFRYEFCGMPGVGTSLAGDAWKSQCEYWSGWSLCTWWARSVVLVAVIWGGTCAVGSERTRHKRTVAALVQRMG